MEPKDVDVGEPLDARGLPAFTIEMFRGLCKVYIIGPKGCGKTTIGNKLRSAGWTRWSPCVMECLEMQTFICVPFSANQYFILFKGSADFACGKARLSQACVRLVNALDDHACLLYDADRDKVYTFLL